MIIIRDSSKIKKYCNMYKVFLKIYYAYVGVLTLLNPPTSELYPSLRQPPPLLHNYRSIHKPLWRYRSMTIEKVKIVRLLTNT